MSLPAWSTGQSSRGRSPVELDAILIRVAQIEGFAHPVVAGSVEFDAGRDQAPQGIAQRRPGGIEDRGMEQAGRAGRRRPSAKALPGIEADMVMIAACRDEGRLVTIGLHQGETQHTAIKVQRTLKVGDLQVDMADFCTGIDGPEGRLLRKRAGHA